MDKEQVENRFRVLITSGGTIEAIDDVREITNTSTGRLGSLTADAFLKAGAEVTYVCSSSAHRPSLPVTHLHIVKSVADLKSCMENLLAGTEYDGIIHSMAVSDYTVRNALDAKLLSELIMDEAKEPITDSARLLDIMLRVMGNYSNTKKKLSSNMQHMVMLMDKTPKIIKMIKELQPNTILVGFKLLAGVGEEELLKIAFQLMEHSNCDFVLANDKEQIHGDNHRALLCDSTGSVSKLSTKQEIALTIAERVLLKCKEN